MLPDNVKLVEVANLTRLYRTQTGEPRLVLNPDKVKDFKPAIGHVFEEYLKPYSHWAFGDVDVVYGSLQRFLSPSILAHDIITFRTDDLCVPIQMLALLLQICSLFCAFTRHHAP